MKKMMKYLVAVIVAVTVIQTSIPVMACEHNTEQGDVSPLCMGLTYLCDGDSTAVYAGSGTHKYGFAWQNTCTRYGYQATSTARCWYCGEKSDADSGYYHDCYMIHSSCGKGRENICLCDGSIPTD